uniref:Uncharacterized protein n=1 Tax=Fagus sylvatica TaxID=28930 RepID=A0A2N9FTY9_FAGSY
MFTNRLSGFLGISTNTYRTQMETLKLMQEGGGSLRSSLTTAASDSGLRPRSQRAMRTERVWRSSPVSRMLDMWNARSSDSLAVRAASGSMSTQSIEIGLTFGFQYSDDAGSGSSGEGPMPGDLVLVVDESSSEGNADVEDVGGVVISQVANQQQSKREATVRGFQRRQWWRFEDVWM